LQPANVAVEKRRRGGKRATCRNGQHGFAVTPRDTQAVAPGPRIAANRDAQRPAPRGYDKVIRQGRRSDELHRRESAEHAANLTDPGHLGDPDEAGGGRSMQAGPGASLRERPGRLEVRKACRPLAGLDSRVAGGVATRHEAVELFLVLRTPEVAK